MTTAQLVFYVMSLALWGVIGWFGKFNDSREPALVACGAVVVFGILALLK